MNCRCVPSEQNVRMPTAIRSIFICCCDNSSGMYVYCIWYMDGLFYGSSSELKNWHTLFISHITQCSRTIYAYVASNLPIACTCKWFSMVEAMNARMTTANANKSNRGGRKWDLLTRDIHVHTHTHIRTDAQRQNHNIVIVFCHIQCEQNEHIYTYVLLLCDALNTLWYNLMWYIQSYSCTWIGISDVLTVVPKNVHIVGFGIKNVGRKSIKTNSFVIKNNFVCVCVGVVRKSQSRTRRGNWLCYYAPFQLHSMLSFLSRITECVPHKHIITGTRALFIHPSLVLVSPRKLCAAVVRCACMS